MLRGSSKGWDKPIYTYYICICIYVHISIYTLSWHSDHKLKEIKHNLRMGAPSPSRWHPEASANWMANQPKEDTIGH